ncbi:MAG: hypothetical protein C0421_02950 [Hyphomonas sp.]|uniref:hypothetical protein n=1 Tax=Hyphomonas sp. TaxID=87 RepID=UPI0025BCC06D|nr:hypothetical protein [Hyphomonas sp.]MBA4337785.1 hypothetical protein [Hyphomonas sp.]
MPTFPLTKIVRAICAVDGEAGRTYTQALTLARKLAHERIIQAEGEVVPRVEAEYSERSAARLTILMALAETNPSVERLRAIIDPLPIGTGTDDKPVYDAIRPGLDTVLEQIDSTEWILEVLAFREPDGTIKFKGGYRKELSGSPYVLSALAGFGQPLLWMQSIPVNYRVSNVLHILNQGV